MRNTITSVLLGFLLVACGDGTDDDAGVVSDAATASDASGGSDAGGGADAGDADGGNSDGGGSDAGSSDGGGADAGGGSDAGPIDAGPVPTVTLRDVAVYSNCMPIVDPDPVLAFWTVDVSGASGATATLREAKLTLTGGSTTTQTLTVDVPSFALTGGSGSQDQRKTASDLVPAGACGELCSDATFSLELSFDIGGHIVVLSESGSFGCVY